MELLSLPSLRCSRIEIAIPGPARAGLRATASGAEEVSRSPEAAPLQALADTPEWCQRAGDEAARRGHLREAWWLFQAMGADGALRCMKREFGDLVG